MLSFDNSGSKARVLEGMLQQRGCPVLACDANSYSDETAPGREYWDERIYCDQVHRWRLHDGYMTVT